MSLIGLILSPIGFILLFFLSKRKNRNAFAWGVVGAVLFAIPMLTTLIIIPLIVLSFLNYLCPNCGKKISRKNLKEDKCDFCGDLDKNHVVKNLTFEERTYD